MCGVHHTFTVWVYAHWDDVLEHTCLDCDTKHTLTYGIAEVANGVRMATK